MCGPKNSAFGGTGTPASSFNNTPVFSEEAGGFEIAAPIFSQPFNSFSAAPPPLKRPDSGGLRFPQNTETPPLPRPNPERMQPALTSLGKVYDFGENPPPRAFDQKIKRDIAKNHRDMTASNNRNISSLEETYLDETTGKVDLKKWTENLRKKYAGPSPQDPLDTKLSPEQIRLHNEKARKTAIKSLIDQREREGQNPGAYSEEGVSREELVGRRLSPEEKAKQDNETRELYQRRSKLAQDETLNQIEPGRTLQDDKELEALWDDFNKRSVKVVVPTLLFGVDLGKETYRQTAIIAEDTVNNVIKARNLFMLKKTLDGDLIVIPKPEVSKNPYARFLASVATMSIPGAAGVRALKGVQSIQRLKKFGNASQKNDTLGTKLIRVGAKGASKFSERATGSALTTNERDPLIAYAFEDKPEVQAEIREYFEGKTTFGTLQAKLLKAGTDGITQRHFRLVLRAIKQMGPEKE